MFIDPSGHERIVVSGGVYKALKQEEGEYYYEFIDSAIAQLRLWKEDLNDGEQLTWLISDYGWTDEDKKMFQRCGIKEGFNLVFITSADDVINYINSKDTSNEILSDSRMDDPITNFSLFSHGLLQDEGIMPLAFDYAGGHLTEEGEILTLTSSHIANIESDAFSNAISYFYSCNTGTEGKSSFAQKWADKTEGVTYAFEGSTRYRDEDRFKMKRGWFIRLDTMVLAKRSALNHSYLVALE